MAFAQFVANIADYGFNIQEALEAGRFTDGRSGEESRLEGRSSWWARHSGDLASSNRSAKDDSRF